jgi:DNA-directed RNA polymerase subunit K/omega
MPPKRVKSKPITKLPTQLEEPIINETKDTNDTNDNANDEDKHSEASADVKTYIGVRPVRKNMQEIRDSLEYKPLTESTIIYLAPENRRSSELMTKFEYAKVVCDRAEQIKNGGVCFTDVDGLNDPIDMAKKEVKDKKCPLCIQRMITDKIAELWYVNEMVIPMDS